MKRLFRASNAAPEKDVYALLPPPTSLEACGVDVGVARKPPTREEDTEPVGVAVFDTKVGLGVAVVEGDGA